MSGRDLGSLPLNRVHCKRSVWRWHRAELTDHYSDPVKLKWMNTVHSTNPVFCLFPVRFLMRQLKRWFWPCTPSTTASLTRSTFVSVTCRWSRRSVHSGNIIYIFLLYTDVILIFSHVKDPFSDTNWIMDGHLIRIALWNVLSHKLSNSWLRHVVWLMWGVHICLDVRVPRSLFNPRLNLEYG